MQIGLKGGNRACPYVGIGARLAGWPIALRPWRRDMRGIANELQNIPLGDPQVFQQMPRGVGDMRWIVIDMRDGERSNCLIEGHMCMSTAKQCKELFAHNLIRTHT